MSELGEHSDGKQTVGGVSGRSRGEGDVRPILQGPEGVAHDPALMLRKHGHRTSA